MNKVIAFFTLILMLSAVLAQQSSAQLTPVGGVGYLTAWTSVGSALFAGGSLSTTVLLESTDDGATWNYSQTGIQSYSPVGALVAQGGVLLAGDIATTYKSLDTGKTWVDTHSGLTSYPYIIRNDTIFTGIDAGSSGSNVYCSVDTGRTWVGIGFDHSNNVRSVVSMDGLLYASTQSNGIYKSSGISISQGTHWAHLTSAFPLGGTLAVVGSTLFCNGTYGSGSGVYKSTDAGVTWTHANTRSAWGWMYASGPNLFWSSDSVFVSSDLGSTWKSLGTAYGARSLYVYHDYLFVAASDQIYRISLVGVVAGVKETKGALPAEYSLAQNYPNPFNPTTHIEFNLAKSGSVRLSVYDMLGNEVARLLDGSLHAGNHTAIWNAASAASGTYVYRLDAGNFSEQKKMILVK